MSTAPHILLIDPYEADRRYYAERLRKTHYVIFEAVTGRMGLDLCRTHPIDCVILEIELPDMSGFEVLVTLTPRASHPEVPVVVLTQLEHTAFLELALKNGAWQALHKRATPGDLLDSTIARAIAKVPRQKLKGGHYERLP